MRAFACLINFPQPFPPGRGSSTPPTPRRPTTAGLQVARVLNFVPPMNGSRLSLRSSPSPEVPNFAKRPAAPMQSIDFTAFLPPISAHPFLRRPRTRICTCTPPTVHTPRLQLTRMQANSGEPHLSRQQDSDITSTNGFALRDAAVYDFVDLSQKQSRFQVAGAYAISDRLGELHYMGYSKNIATKLVFHQRLVPDKCSSFRVYVPPVPPELISPEMLENVLEYWVRENGAVPRGNTVDRALWENPNPADRKTVSTPHSPNPSAENKDDGIPIRERSTARRVASRRESAQYYSPDPFADTFRSSTGASTSRRRKDPNGWTASEDDYVEVDVDPLDPFSASKRRRSTRAPWDSPEDDDEDQEDWFPILALMGVAGLIWLVGLLGNALPAATPSLGM